MSKTIENTKTVYLDGDEYTRVYYANSDLFEDVPSEIYEEWKGLHAIESNQPGQGRP